ncbi:hypothetical protein NDU88_001011 [Pleurodeles waltl]|uniref:Helix-turn-helix domain-containing protein n=1 Tax=Pleurodeles waltl TaxID=8319 RepID=A0AAV7PBB1_PLEWA|nr:hypothetical protein NDU88_001011 [Pleurodeles waltl]
MTKSGTREDATTFVEWLNALNPFLRFTSTIGDIELSFLDLLIAEKDGFLKTEVFYKPTDRNNLLQFQSFHPRSLKDNLPVGQFLRLRRNCSELAHYTKRAKKLTKKLRAKGYLAHITRRAEKKGRFSHGYLLLQPSERSEKKERLICVTTFNPLSNTVN